MIRTWTVLVVWRSYETVCALWVSDVGLGNGLVRVHMIYIRYWYGWVHSWSGLHVRLYIHGLTRSHTFSHGLVRPLINTITHERDPRTGFFFIFKNLVQLSRIHSNGLSVTWIMPRLVRMYVRFIWVDNRVSRWVLCEIGLT